MKIPNLKPAQLERLALLAEELAEAIGVVGKILRHGYESYNPHDRTKCPNGQLLARELGDVRYAIDLLVRSGDLYWTETKLGRRLAGRKKPEYLHHQTKRILRELSEDSNS